jgi:hypothetical protein
MDSLASGADDFDKKGKKKANKGKEKQKEKSARDLPDLMGDMGM